MARHATRMQIDFLHNGNYPEEWIVAHIRFMINETLNAYNLEYLGADFESIDHEYPEKEDK